MAEAASQLNLEILIDENSVPQLIPSSKKKPMYLRSNTQIFLGIWIIGVVSTLVRWLQHEFRPLYYPPILIVGIIMMIIRREQVKGKYYLVDDGLLIPYMWFYRRKIPISSIINVTDDTIVEESTGQSYAAIRINVDTPLIKLNITGLQSPNILLSTMDYDSMDLNRFADQVSKKKRETIGGPNTLAQRLTDQVDRAWSNRWKLIFLNIADSSLEVLIYLFVFESFVFGFFGLSIWPIFGLSLLGFYVLVVFVLQVFYKPQAIIGIRPNELGPLIYDEEELVTSVRFIIICQPYTVHLQDCEVIYPEGTTTQVGRLQQIQPDLVPPGELTYGIAQIIGNHTKGTGAILRFSYKETEDKRDVFYEIPIHWG